MYENQSINNVNAVRTQLLVLADKEMSEKLKHPSLQINSIFPRKINYCKDNNFGLTITQNFCSSRVTYNEDTLIKAKNKIKISCKTVLYTPRKEVNNNLFLQRNSTSEQTQQYECNNITGTPTIDSLRRINKRILTKKSVLNEIMISQSQKSEEELNGSKSNISINKKHNYTRNNPASYLDDPAIFLTIAKSFKYIRNLPIINKNYSCTNNISPELKRIEEEKLKKACEELENSLIIKDGLDSDNPAVMKKLSKMRIESKEMEENKSMNISFNAKKYSSSKFSSSKSPIRISTTKRTLVIEAEIPIKPKKNSSTNLFNVGKFNPLSLFSPDKRDNNQSDDDSKSASFNLKLEMDDNILSENNSLKWEHDDDIDDFNNIDDNNIVRYEKDPVKNIKTLYDYDNQHNRTIS